MSPAVARNAASRPAVALVLVAFVAILALLVMPRPAQAAPGQTVGLHAHLLWNNVDNAELTRQLDQVTASGAQIIRVDVGWSSLEQNGKGQISVWYRDRLDNLVNEAERRGLKLLFTVADGPCWASSAPASLKQDCAGSWWDRGVQYYTPTNPQDYADAFVYLIKRYGTRVAAWEIWNEPNSPDYYKSTDAVRDYVALVKTTYRAAKAADPRAKILAGAVMQSDYEWTEKLYKAGIKGSFDAFSIHPYCEDRGPMDPWVDEWMRLSFIRGVPKVREIMRKYGDTKPMWLTEFGWSTSTTRNVGPQVNGVDEALQAKYVKDALAQVSRWSYVQTVIYYNLKNTLDDRASLYGNYGLVRRDGTREPAFEAFRTASVVFKAAAKTSAVAPAPAAVVTADAVTAPATAVVQAAPAAATPALASKSPRPPSVRRVRGGLRITGSSTPSARVKLALYRVSAGRTAKRPTLKCIARTNGAGRFTILVRDRRVAHGLWRAANGRLR